MTAAGRRAIDLAHRAARAAGGATPTDDVAPPFYSGMERAIAAMPQEVAPAEQWSGAIKNAPGVKQEEQDWSGVHEFLGGQKGKPVPKADLLNYVRNNGVQVNEVLKGTPMVNRQSKYALPEVLHAADQARQDGDDIALTVANDGDAYRALTRKFPELSDNEDWANEVVGDVWPGALPPSRPHQTKAQLWLQAVRDNGTQPYSQGDAQTLIHRAAGGNRQAVTELEGLGMPEELLDPFRNRTGGESGAQFKEHTLPGGENYRELLLTLPPRPDRAAAALRDFESQFNSKPIPADRYQQWNALRDAVAGAKPFTAGHWDEPNVLAHVRFNDRKDADGKKVLMLEEVQSDWHQKGRKGGYQGSPDDVDKKIDAINDELRRRGNLSEEAGPEDWHRVLQANPGLRDQRDNLYRGRPEGGAVPNAPFKTSWPDLAMRRMVRWGAENGYDKIAWTPGDVQADRYDLSRQMDRLEYAKNDDGTFRLTTGKGSVMSSSPESQRVRPEDLPDFVGKDMADKIIAAADSKPKGKFSGLDLRVGGEGMRGFYDDILPKVASKIGKKHGAKVGTAKINTGPISLGDVTPSMARTAATRAATARNQDAADAFHDAAARLDRGMRPRTALNGLGAEDIATHMPEAIESGGPTTVHSMDITPSLRAAVMKGQPMFRRGGRVTKAIGGPLGSALSSIQSSFQAPRPAAAAQPLAPISAPAAAAVQGAGGGANNAMLSQYLGVPVGQGAGFTGTPPIQAPVYQPVGFGGGNGGGITTMPVPEPGLAGPTGLPDSGNGDEQEATQERYTGPEVSSEGSGITWGRAGKAALAAAPSLFSGNVPGAVISGGSVLLTGKSPLELIGGGLRSAFGPKPEGIEHDYGFVPNAPAPARDTYAQQLSDYYANLQDKAHAGDPYDAGDAPENSIEHDYGYIADQPDTGDAYQTTGSGDASETGQAWTDEYGGNVEGWKKGGRVDAIDRAAAKTDTKPTDAQKAAGNYRKGNVTVLGMDIAIENPRGSYREGRNRSGKSWRQKMAHHYGYVRGTEGKDRDAVDVFVGPDPDLNKVFVVDQTKTDGSFDEHKAMLGFDTIDAARAGYLANYEPGWSRLGAISEMPVDAFRSWVKDGVKTKPLSYRRDDKSGARALAIAASARRKG